MSTIRIISSTVRTKLQKINSTLGTHTLWRAGDYKCILTNFRKNGAADVISGTKNYSFFLDWLANNHYDMDGHTLN